MTGAKKGDTVKVDYEGSFDDGKIFDNSKSHGAPIEFEVGTGKVIKGFDDAIAGMKKGEEKTIKIAAADGYGEYMKELVKEVAKEQMPADQEPKAGMMLAIGLPNGEQIPAKITKVTDKTVTIDLNHPLAGKNLNFKLALVDLNSGSKEKSKK